MGAQSKYAVPSFTKNRIASIVSTTGKTTLSTTDLICDWAVVHVCSIAPDTSPAANTVTDKTVTKITIITKQRRLLKNFFFIDFSS